MTATLTVYRADAELDRLRHENERLQAELAKFRGQALLPWSGPSPDCAKCGEHYGYAFGFLGEKTLGVSMKWQKARPWLGRPERFKRHCYACGATWYESTKDASPGGSHD